MNAIEVSQVDKSYFYTEKYGEDKGLLAGLLRRKKVELKAIQSFDLQIAQGEFVGLIGPNGAGKSTLIKMLTGVIQPTSGRISVLGYAPQKAQDSFKKKYALVMGQKSQLWWDLPCMDTLALNKAIYEIDDARFAQRVQQLSQLFGVRELLGKQVRRLSLGERMKMEIIAAILHEPEILFLDEPTIGLDVIAQKMIRDFLRDVNSRLHITILLTSHYMEEIKQLCKRVVVINHGRKMYDGALADVLNKYKESKTLTVLFAESGPVRLSVPAQVLEREAYRIKFKLAKEQVYPALKELVERYKIEDVSIEEEDIGDLIEKLYNEE